MKKFTKSMVGMLVLAMVFIGFRVPSTYADAPSPWAYDIVEEARETNLTTERILSDYQEPITREEFAEVVVQLYKALGGVVEESTKGNPFVDTENPIVLQAYHLGIINGQSATHFAPNATITRQELSVMLVRVMKALDPNFKPILTKSVFFIDQNQIAQWAMEEMHYLFEQGVIEGVSLLRIDPRGLTTREQAIALVKRAYDLYERTIRQADALRIGVGYDARSLDPHGANDNSSSRVMRQIYETLVVQNENMDIEPGLAQSWKFVGDRAIEFELKKGVKFHNGEEFTAKDVKFTLSRAVESPHVGHILGQIDPNGIKIIDDYTVQIATTEPYPPILTHLAHVAGSMLNEKAVTKFGENYGQNPVGTGAFKLDAWYMGDSIELVKFNDYHGGMARAERVVFKSIPDNISRFEELENGRIHVAYDFLPNDIHKIENHSEITLQRTPSFSATYVGFNAQVEPFNDTRVRQAINYAVDMDRIIETVMQGAAEAASGPLGSAVWASNKNLKPYEYDLEKAKKLLKDAGYSNGFTTSIWVNDNQQRIDIATMIAEQLGKVGIDVEVKILEWGEYLDGTANGDHDMFVLGWTTVTGDPDYGLYSLFHSSQFGYLGNRTFYANEKVDKLLDKGRMETDPEARREIYLEVQELIREEAPWIFAWINENLIGVRDNVKGIDHHPAGYDRLSGAYLE